jgi:hypothetical protein
VLQTATPTLTLTINSFQTLKVCCKTATLVEPSPNPNHQFCPNAEGAIHAKNTIAEDLKPAICVLTAHPAKFEAAVLEACGTVPADTPAVHALKQLPRDKFKSLRKSSPSWRQEWINELKTDVERGGRSSKL